MLEELQKHLRDNDLRNRDTNRNVKAVLTNQTEHARRAVVGMTTIKSLFQNVLNRINTLQGWLYKWTHEINDKLDVTNASLDIIGDVLTTESKTAENRYQVLRHGIMNTGGKIDFLNNLIVPMGNQITNLFGLLKGVDKGICSIQIGIIILMFFILSLGVSQSYIIWKLNQLPLAETNVVQN